MRTNIELDVALVEELKQATGLRTKREVVQLGLETLARIKRQERMRDLRGRVDWVGDLDELRAARLPDWGVK